MIIMSKFIGDGNINLLKQYKNTDFLKIGAAYSIIQVVAQDLGIKTGKKQRNLVQSLPIQFFILYSAAFFVTDNQKLAFVTVLIYYYLKYIYSEGKTSNVCFENV